MFIYFEFLRFSRPKLVVSYVQIRQTKNSYNYRSFTERFLCDIQNLMIFQDMRYSKAMAN